MLDSKLLRSDIESIVSNLARRGAEVDTDSYQSLETDRKALQVVVEKLRSERNTQSKAIGQAKAAGEDIAPLREAVEELGDELSGKEKRLRSVQRDLTDFELNLPNVLHEDVPDGESDADNVEVRRWGEPTQFDFSPKDHVDLGQQIGGMDFETASALSGSRFVALSGQVAQLHRALGQFMLDVQTREHGYQELNLPLLVFPEILQGTGQLPKFEEDLFAVGEDHYLIPTSEVTLANTVRNKILSVEDLPLRLTSLTPCFRAEAGSYGKDTRGMIRQHQFEKVELVQIVEPEKSMAALEEMVGHAEAILQKLELPYRVVKLCTGDIGFAAHFTYDLEVWLPGQDTYREISSCSNCTDFQARRMQTRWRSSQQSSPELVHTLNGSGLAVGHTLVAVMENYQQTDGSIKVPSVLQPYMNGLQSIGG